MPDQIQDELQFHVDAKVRDLMAGGLSREQALARARREVGDLRAFAEACESIVQQGGRRRERRRYWLGWRDDLRYAARGLRRNPQFSVPAVAIFALGVGLATAVFAVLHAIVLNPLPYPRGAELHQLFATNLSKTNDRSAMSPGDFFAVRVALAPDAGVGVGAYMRWPISLTGVPEPERLEGALVSVDLFRTLGVAPIEGRPFHADEEEPARSNVAIISARLAARLGLTGRAAGATLQFGTQPVTVVGVMPPSFGFPERETDAWIPLALRPADRDSHEARWLHAVARVPSGALDTVLARIQTVMARLAAEHPASNDGWRAALVPLHSVVVAQARPTLIVLSMAIACVLLVMIVNLLTAVSARLRRRREELALQEALGAGVWRLTRQLGTEALLIASAGGGLGLLLAGGLVGAFRSLAPVSIPRAADVTLSPSPIAFAIGAGALAVFVVTAVPVWRARRRAQHALNPTRGAAGASPSRVPVVAQAGLACALIIVAGLLAQAFIRLSTIDLGFSPDHVLTLRISLPRSTAPDRQAAYFDGVVERLRTVPGVAAAGATSDLPLSGNSLNVPIAVDGATNSGNAEIRAALRVITPGYLETVAASVRGRAFAGSDTRTAAPVALVNESLARLHWPKGDAIGRRIRTNEDAGWRTIVGVVSDVHHGELATSEGPALYVPHAQKAESWMTWMAVAVRTAGSPRQSAAAIRSAVAERDRNQPVSNVQPLADLVDDALALPRLAAFIAIAVAAITLILAAAGLASTLSLYVSTRSGEFSVRLALGAVPSALARRIVAEAFALVTIGAAIGCVAAAAAGRMLAALLYGITAYDLPTFLAATVILMATAGLIAIGPARAVLGVDPSRALRG